MRKKLAVAIGAALFAMAFASPALADRIVVDNDGVECPNPDSFTIQGGVFLAQPGDTVFVCAGTYIEQVLVAGPAKNDIRIVGADVDEVIVDGNNTLINGFRLENVSGVELERFTVQRYHDNIVLVDADGNTIRENVSTATWDHDAIQLNSSDGNLIEKNVAFATHAPIGCGINLIASSDNVVRDNLVYANPNAGILVQALGSGNEVTHNVARNNVGGALPNANGIRNANAPATLIAHNLVQENGHHGIRVTGAASTDVRVEHNDVLLNGTLNDDDGIRLDTAASGNTVSHNDSERNRHDGVHLVGVNGNVVEHNELVHNGSPVGNGCGVDVDTGGANNVVTDNHAEGHDNSGVRVLNAGTGNVVAYNDLSGNGRNGVLNQNTIGTLIEHNHADHNVGFGAANGAGIRVNTSPGTPANPIVVRENSTDQNSENGIAVGMSQNVIVERNHSNGNALDGIRSGPAPTGSNFFLSNYMLHNGEHDAHDENRAANTWTDNHCKTDFPPGTIC